MCPGKKCIKESINFAKESVMNYLKDKEKWLLIFVKFNPHYNLETYRIIKNCYIIHIFRKQESRFKVVLFAIGSVFIGLLV